MIIYYWSFTSFLLHFSQSNHLALLKNNQYMYWFYHFFFSLRKSHLEPYLPSHPIVDPMALMQKRARSFGVVSAAPYGSAAILPISWAYVKVGTVTVMCVIPVTSFTTFISCLYGKYYSKFVLYRWWVHKVCARLHRLLSSMQTTWPNAWKIITRYVLCVLYVR